MLKLDPDEVDKAFTTAQRSAAKLVKSFKEVPGCLGIAKQVKDEMADFAQNVPVVQALRNPGMRDRPGQLPQPTSDYKRARLEKML